LHNNSREPRHFFLILIFPKSVELVNESGYPNLLLSQHLFFNRFFFASKPNWPSVCVGISAGVVLHKSNSPFGDSNLSSRLSRLSPDLQLYLSGLVLFSLGWNTIPGWWFSDSIKRIRTEINCLWRVPQEWPGLLRKSREGN